MASGIGAKLREARSRRRIELAQAEADTKIRIRFLRAMENEEWDVLPGEAYARSFVRTYGTYLGLDGERLADDLRRERREAATPGPVLEPAAPVAGGRSPSRFSGKVVGTLVVVSVLAVLIGAALAGRDGAEDSQREGEARTVRSGDDREGTGQRARGAPARPSEVSVRMTAREEVWVCLVDSSGSELIDGLVLAPGESMGPYRSGGFEVSFGNGYVDLLIDGEPTELEESASPLGYAIGAGGELSPLTEAERPTCV